MNATTQRLRRILRTELLRGGALPITVGFIAVLAPLLVLGSSWAGNWLGLAMTSRAHLSYVLPLLITVATWVGGREGRRLVLNVMRSVPRPAIQRVGMTWIALTLGASIGFLTAWLLVGVVFVAPVATHSSGGWAIALLVAMLAFGAVVALGLAIGYFARSSLVVPVPGVVLAMLFKNLPILDEASWHYLAPYASSGEGAATFTNFGNLTQAAWFVALTVACLMLIGIRRKWLSAVPAAIAVMMVSLIVSAPPERIWADDPVSNELACTKVRETDLCIPRYREHLLDDYARVADPVLAKMEDVSTTPERVNLGRNDYLRAIPNIWGELTSPAEEVDQMARNVIEASNACAPGSGWGPAPAPDSPQPDFVQPDTDDLEDAAAAETIASTWLTEDHPLPPPKQQTGFDPPASAKLVNTAKAGEKRVWLHRYLTALRSCDVPALHDLPTA